MSDFDIENLSYIKALQKIEGIGATKIKKILSFFPNKESLENSSYLEISKIEGISENLAKRIKNNFSDCLDEAKLDIEKEAKILEKINAKAITLLDQNYPRALKNIFDPPPVIYFLGEIKESDLLSLAIVGTRNPTNYGKTQTEIFARELSQAGLTIISGLALGVDSIAHKIALQNNSRTIAVTGCGIDIIYPKENKDLYYQIIENGAAITEQPPGTKPEAANFPKRNRIISALSKAVLIIETGIDGGAMHTANYAIEHQKKLFALPGPVNSTKSGGPNLLIQKNLAKLVLKPGDILKEFKLPDKKNSDASEENMRFFALNIFEQKICEALQKEPLHIDQIAEVTKMQISDCLSSLLSLEFKGVVKQLPGKYFCLV